MCEGRCASGHHLFVTASNVSPASRSACTTTHLFKRIRTRARSRHAYPQSCRSSPTVCQAKARWSGLAQPGQDQVTPALLSSGKSLLRPQRLIDALRSSTRDMPTQLPFKTSFAATAWWAGHATRHCCSAHSLAGSVGHGMPYRSRHAAHTSQGLVHTDCCFFRLPHDTA